MMRRLARVALVTAGVAPLGATAQRPAPLDNAVVIERLPKPGNLTVRQDALGYVELSWSPVAGARRYILGRSVGTNGYQQVNQPFSGTLFVDHDVTGGVRVSYSVTPVDSSGVAGFRALSADFVPTLGPKVAAPVAHPVAAIQGTEIVVHWDGLESRRYAVRWARTSGTSGSGGTADVGLQHEFRLPSQPGAYSFAVITRPMSAVETESQSEYVTLRVPDPSSSTTGTATGTGPTPTLVGTSSAAAAPSEVALVVAAPVTLRVGATASVSAAAGARWSTLDPAVASVNAAGTVSAVAAGRARIVALSPQSDGTLRITVVHVLVTP